MTESVADFKQRIAIIRRRIETGKEYSIIGASRRPAWCCDARGNEGVSGQRTINQDDSTGIVERRKPTKPTKKTILGKYKVIDNDGLLSIRKVKPTRKTKIQ